MKTTLRFLTWPHLDKPIRSHQEAPVVSAQCSRAQPACAVTPWGGLHVCSWFYSFTPFICVMFCWGEVIPGDSPQFWAQISFLSVNKLSVCSLLHSWPGRCFFPVRLLYLLTHGQAKVGTPLLLLQLEGSARVSRPWEVGMCLSLKQKESLAC